MSEESEALVLEREIVRKLMRICQCFDSSFESRRVKWSSRKGAPDLLLLFPARKYGCFVETKRPKGGIVTPHQAFEHQLLSAAGFDVFMISNEEELKFFDRGFNLMLDLE